ncbi:MAG: glycoside hydrolase domain-containing protein [Candidatus Latescibacterota bacterium]
MTRAKSREMDHKWEGNNTVAQKNNTFTGNEIPYGIGDWPRDLGNHRARILVHEGADAVWLHLPWRRRDRAPHEKAVVIRSAATGQKMENVVCVQINREYGDILFGPDAGAGEYHVYYMPYTVSGDPWKEPWKYASGHDVPHPTADSEWLDRLGLPRARLADFPKAHVLEIQARTPFDSMYPMEVIATAGETAHLIEGHLDKPFLLFPEDRAHSIRMRDDLPQRWILRSPGSEFSGEARRGECYAFQIGVYASLCDLEDLAVDFSDLSTVHGDLLSGTAFFCTNLHGTDWLGRPLQKKVSVDQGKVQALWVGVQIPKDAAVGDYFGTLLLSVKGTEPIPLSLRVSVEAEVLEDSGDSELWRHSRLRWLDSTLGLDDTLVAPYTPLEVDASTVRCLGRAVRISDAGLPGSIRSNDREILVRPMALVVETAGGILPLAAGGPKIDAASPGSVIWESQATRGPLSMHCRAQMEFDGYIDFCVTIATEKPLSVRDIRLEIPIRRDIAAYMMGMGRKGGYRPESWTWKWDIARADHMVWIGEGNAGLQCKLKWPDATWEISNLHASGLPKTWDNGGRGGCTVTEEGADTVIVRVTSGERTLRPGEALPFGFGLLVTPVKPLDPAHWDQRYCHHTLPPDIHTPVPSVDDALACEATIINVHHASKLNPNINYPFIAGDELSAYVREAHRKGVKVKIYYTVRELSNRVAELWALRSLGDEIYLDGPGGGDAWLAEHLESGYSPGWHQMLPDGEVDAAIRTSGLSRWHNYYLEGLAWLLRNIEIDGLYLDGIGYDRDIMKRVRRIVERERPGGLIDFHSGNEFHFGLSPANKYMEHFPYLSSLWFGEGYDYDASPDYWLVEVSGIPFGLYGEMLHDHGNPWRGMVYGMTARYYDGADPKHIWRVWDRFGMGDVRMIGYWEAGCPVRTDHKEVLATAYCKEGKVLVALASWAGEPVRVRLQIDWETVGLDPLKATLHASEIPEFQEAAAFGPSDQIPVDPARGWLLVLAEDDKELG